MKWLLLRSAEDRADAAGLTGLNARPSAVLELLLLQANRTVSTEEIIDQLWPIEPPQTGRNSVQRFVADLRNALGHDRGALETVGGGYRLSVEVDDLDVERVEAMRRQAADHRADAPALAAELLDGALAHFGDLDSIPAATPAAEAARQAHQELRLELLDERMEAGLDAGDGAKLIRDLRTLTDEHPYRERFWGQLMRTLRADGQRVEALRVFDQLRRRLAEDIGIGPSVELCQLELQILTESDGRDADPSSNEPAGTAGPTGADRPLGADEPTGPTATPVPPDLIGRDDEMVGVIDLLASRRVVTVTGPGGVGKTRLVTEVARRSAGRGPEPTIARLAEAATADQVPTVVAAALGLHSEALGQDEGVEDILLHLQRWPRLVVLDNAEHVIEAVRNLLDRAVDGTDCHFLVSSRQRIGVSSEWVADLGPLSLPREADNGHSDAERLFQLRASAVGADLGGEEETVAAICRALDGLPLALELAAAQLAHIGLHDLLDRLDARRLELSASPGQGTRHSSLASMMEWSWDLLSPAEIALLEQLAVFNSAIDLAVAEDLATAAEPAAGEGPNQAGVLAILTSLSARSLVSSTVVDGRARFSLLETVRLYALARAERDGRLATCRDAHAAYLLRFLRQWPLPELNAWLDTIERVEVHQLEYAPALEWLDQQGRWQDVIELATRVTGLWARRGPADQLARWATRLLELAEANDLDHEWQSAVAVVAAEDRFRFADYEAMAVHGERLVELEERQPTDLGTPFLAFYATAVYTAALDDESRRRVELANRRAADTPTRHLNEAQTEMWLGCCQLINREFEEALASFSSVLSRTGRPGGVLLWSELGQVAALHILGRPGEARAAMETVGSTNEDSIWNHAVDIVRAVVAAAGGDIEEARIDLAAAARRRMRERRATSRDDFQIGFGLVAAAAGDHGVADDLLAEPMPQSPVTLALLFNHLHPEPIAPDRWQAVWGDELLPRLFGSDERFRGELAPVDVEVARWTGATNS